MDTEEGARAQHGSQQAPAQFLTFALQGEVFAMDIASVREIIEVCRLTSVPLMPAFVRGVINLRGAVVPVLDLNARLGRAATATGRRTCIVIYEGGCAGERVQLGLIVDAVSEVIEIDAAHIEPAPAFGASVRRDFIRGMGRVQDRFVILLDPDRAFDVDEIAQACATGAVEARLAA